MAYKPKENHPWKRYKDKKPTGELYEAMVNAPSLKNFLTNLVQNWETYNIPIDDEEYTKLKSISDEKAAIWLVNFLRKTWTNRNLPTPYGYN